MKKKASKKVLPAAILFDLDDTILAFSKASMQAWEACCNQFVQENDVSFTSEELLKGVTKVRDWY